MAELSHARDAGLTLGELTLDVVWNLRGNAVDAAFASVSSRVLGLPLPVEPLTSTCGRSTALLWLGPRSWLYVGGDASTAIDFDSSRRPINAAGGALFDVSSGYVAWRVAGADAARTLNRACPLDLHPRAFATGECRHTLYSQVPILIEKQDNAPKFMVLIPRSYASDVWHALSVVAAQYAHELRAPTPFG